MPQPGEIAYLIEQLERTQMTEPQRDHILALSVDPPGACVVTRHWDGTDAWLTIKQANPHVMFTDDLLTDLADGGDNGGIYPGMTLDGVDRERWNHRSPGLCFIDTIVRIEGRDRTVFYRIGQYTRRGNAWPSSWPD
jgi:hypothetical protein